MRIAFLTTRLFETPSSGGEICSARLADALRTAGHELVGLGRADHPAHTGQEIVLGPLGRPFDDLGRAEQLATLSASWLSGRACTVQRLVAGRAAHRAAQGLSQLQRDGLDLIVVDHLQSFALLRGLDELPPLMLVMHNVESAGYLERARRIDAHGPAGLLQRHVLRRESHRLRVLERLALDASAAVACLSEDDASHLRALIRGRSRAPAVEVLPGYPATPLAPPRPAGDGLQRIGLIGTWTWGPNRDALRWMLGEVLPRLPAHCRLVLAGTGLDGWTLPPRCESLGRVADARTLYEAVDLVAVPSLHGSGVQEKAIEATGSGRPVVATPHALRGLGPALPLHVHAAEGAAHFAQLCASVQPALDAGPALDAWASARRHRYAAALSRCLNAARQQAAATRVRPAPLGRAAQSESC